MTGCSDNNNYDELPRPIAQFVSQYWPNSDIVSYSQPAKDDYQVIIKNGPSLHFDAEYQWTSVEGNGLPLPETFVFNCMPAPLYRYLESTQQTSQVFSVKRDARYYYLDMFDSDIDYSINSQTVTVL